jgi:heat shock protein HtpX
VSNVERRPLGRDRGLSFRMAVCLTLLVALYAPVLAWVLAVAWFLTGSGLKAALVGAGAVVLVAAAPYLSEVLALSLSRAARPDAAAERRLRPLVERLAAMADVPPPRLAVMPTDVPNAFSAGARPSRSIVVVTRGLLERLDDAELEAVLAHELTHVANRDAVVMTVAAGPTMLGRKVLWGFVSLPATADSISGKLVAAFALLYLLPLVFVGWVGYAFATLLVMTLSRYREFVADRGAALLTGSPESLMSALQKIADAVSLIPERDLRSTVAIKALFVLPAQSRSGGFEIDPLRMFPTHPPLEQRLERLAALGRELGRPSRGLPERTAAPLAAPKPPRPANLHARGAFVLAFAFWGSAAAAILARPESVGGGILVVALVAVAFLVFGVVLALQGVGRASAGASGMGFAVAALALLVGPWALSFAAVVVVGVLGVLGFGPL